MIRMELKEHIIIMSKFRDTQKIFWNGWDMKKLF